VVVHDDAARVLVDAFRSTGAAAVFGAYDDLPAAANFLSQYKNLVHHHYHSEGAGASETFWAGCGAVRKSAFLDVGGSAAARLVPRFVVAFAVGPFGLEVCALRTVDPVEYRTGRLADPPGQEVIRRAAALMGWQPRPAPRPPDPGAAVLTGRGIAYVHYKHAENHVAIGMEVAVERATGVIRVTRVVCAQDCGLMINPDNVASQLEGNILQTLSRTLHEEVVFDRDSVTSVDWARYPILTFPEVPRLEFELIQRLDQPPLGVGEAASTPVPAALGNAVFDATGVRLRTVPFRADRVKAAMTGARS